MTKQLLSTVEFQNFTISKYHSSHVAEDSLYHLVINWAAAVTGDTIILRFYLRSVLNGYLFHTLSWCDKCARVFTAAGEDRWNKQKAGTLLLVTFIKVSIILCVLGEREAVGDLKSVVDYQAQQDALNHLTALALFLVVLDNLQHHLWKGKKRATLVLQ